MNKKKGIFLMLLSTFSFSCMSICVKLTANEVTINQQMFFRNLISLIIMFPYIGKTSNQIKEIKNNIVSLCLRSVFGICAVYTLFKATSIGLQGIVSAINKLSPLFVIMLSSMVMKEKVTGRIYLAIIISIIGIVFILPDFTLNDIKAILFALLSAFFNGCAYTVLGYLKGKVSPKLVVLFFSAFTCLFFLPTIIKTNIIFSFETIAGIIGIGVFAAIGQICVTMSYQVASVSDVALYENWGTFFSIILSYLIFREQYNLRMLIGTIFLVLSSVLVG